MRSWLNPPRFVVFQTASVLKPTHPKKRLRQGAALKGGLLAAVHVQSHVFCVCLLYLCMLTSLTFLFVFSSYTYLPLKITCAL